jgi:hypothetical protein
MVRSSAWDTCWLREQMGSSLTELSSSIPVGNFGRVKTNDVTIQFTVGFSHPRFMLVKSHVVMRHGRGNRNKCYPDHAFGLMATFVGSDVVNFGHEAVNTVWCTVGCSRVLSHQMEDVTDQLSKVTPKGKT